MGASPMAFVANSAISNLGSLVTARNPNFKNNFGYDADTFNATGNFINGATSAVFRFSADAEGVFPGVIAMAIESLEAILMLTPSDNNFGNQAVGTTSAAATFTLSNSGTEAATIVSIGVTGDYARTGGTCPASGSLAFGASYTIFVAFTPTAGGLRNGALAVTTDAAGSPHTATLTGTGLIPDLIPAVNVPTLSELAVVPTQRPSPR